MTYYRDGMKLHIATFTIPFDHARLYRVVSSFANDLCPVRKKKWINITKSETAIHVSLWTMQRIKADLTAGWTAIFLKTCPKAPSVTESPAGTWLRPARLSAAIQAVSCYQPHIERPHIPTRWAGNLCLWDPPQEKSRDL